MASVDFQDWTFPNKQIIFTEGQCRHGHPKHLMLLPVIIVCLFRVHGEQTYIDHLQTVWMSERTRVSNGESLLVRDRGKFGQDNLTRRYGGFDGWRKQFSVAAAQTRRFLEQSRNFFGRRHFFSASCWLSKNMPIA